MLYEQGYTIGGARAHLMSGNVKDDSARTQLLIHQMLVELEEILELLK